MLKLRNTFIGIFIFFLLLNSLIIGYVHKEGLIKADSLLRLFESQHIQEEKNWQRAHYLEAEPIPVKSGMVTFRFDDGYASTYKEALPILEKYNMTGVAAVITDKVGSFSYMTWEQIRRLFFQHWEIMSHTVTHPKLLEISPAKAKLEITKSKKDLEGHGLLIVGLATPGASVKAGTVLDEIQRDYLYCTGQKNANDIPLGNPYLVGNFSGHTIRKFQLKEIIDFAQKQNQWVIFVFHRIDRSGRKTSTSPAYFEGIVKDISSSQLKVVTMSQGIKAIDGR